VTALDALLAKLDRADETMRTFERKLRRFSNANPLIVGVEVDFQSGWNTAKILRTDPIPQALSVLIGESVYHGRSMLEHLVWALAKANHKKPGEHNSFPIDLTRRSNFASYHTRLPGGGRDKGGKLRGVSKGAVALIEGLQPYHAQSPANHLLAIVDAMARDDRHRAPYGVYSAGRGPEYAGSVDLRPLFVPTRGYRIVEFRSLLRHGQRVVAETKLARFRVAPLTRNNKVRVEGELPKFIAFGNRETGFVFAQDFMTINRKLRELLADFAKFL
jgi:hypothetical protein